MNLTTFSWTRACSKSQSLKEVLVRVYAAGVAPADWKTRQGLLKDLRPMQLPYIPGSALAGIVEEVGPGVTAWKIGQAVFGHSAKGTYTEYTTASVGTLAFKPETLSFDEAATLAGGATTAWQGLFEYGSLQTGQHVLIRGAAHSISQRTSLYSSRLVHFLRRQRARSLPICYRTC